MGDIRTEQKARYNQMNEEAQQYAEALYNRAPKRQSTLPLEELENMRRETKNDEQYKFLAALVESCTQGTIKAPMWAQQCEDRNVYIMFQLLQKTLQVVEEEIKNSSK